MEEAKLINITLSRLYGKALDGHMKFRLAWSDSLTEVRKGRFDKYSSGGIYLCTVEEIREATKYSYIKERWILEAYERGAEDQPDIYKSDGYEPIYVFWSKDHVYLKPRLDVCEDVIKAWLDVKHGIVIRKNDRIVANEAESARQKEEDEYYDELTQDGTEGKFSSGEAVLIHKP